MGETDVKKYLKEHDQEFRQLIEQHQDYDRQLKELLSKPYLNEQDQMQETILKKKKLALKDQMQVRIERYRAEHPA